jgi:hypothetical protein
MLYDESDFMTKNLAIVYGVMGTNPGQLPLR